MTLTRQAAQATVPLRLEQNGNQLVIRLIIEHRDRCLLPLADQTLPRLDSLKLLELSLRETEVLCWVIRGEDKRAIAKHLKVHPSTVRNHPERLFHRLGVQSQTEAIA